MISTNLKPPIRREPCATRQAQIIDAALRLARKVGAQGLTRDRIAAEVGISGTLLHRYFGSMDLMREIIIKTAFARRDTEVLYKSISIEDFKNLNTDRTLTENLCKFLQG